MTTMFKNLGVCLAAGLLFVFSPSLVQAQGGTVFSLAVVPPVAYITLKPGDSFVAKVSVQNEGSTSVTLTPTLVDFEADPSGAGIVLGELTTFPYLDQTQPTELHTAIRLQPGEKRNIALPMKVPSYAINSEHHLTLLFPTAEVDEAGNTLSGAQISGVIGSNIIVMISPTNQDQSQLTIGKYDGVTFIDSFTPLSFRLFGRNAGPLAGIASGSAQIVKGNGEVVARWSIYPDVILAHSTRLLRTTGREVSEPDDDIQPSSLFSYKAPFLIGPYHVRVTFGSANQLNRVDTTYQVIAFPFLVTGLLLIGSMLIIGYKILIKKLPIGKRLQTY